MADVKVPEIKVCQMKVKRLKEGDRLVVEIQNHKKVPDVGDVLDVTSGETKVKGRVVKVNAPPPGQLGIFYLDLEEVAAGAT